jgi:hypothetical protein
MLVYNYHPDTLEYLGELEADQSPLDEPGVFLIPAHATTLKPPAPIEGKQLKFIDGAWKNVEIPPPPPEPALPDPGPPPRDVHAELDDIFDALDGLAARIAKLEAKR